MLEFETAYLLNKENSNLVLLISVFGLNEFKNEVKGFRESKLLKRQHIPKEITWFSNPKS